MQIKIQKIFLLVISILFFTSLYSATVYSKNNGGDWSSPSTWTGGQMPSSGDSVIITENSVVVVDCNCGEYESMDIVVEGELYFEKGQKLDLDNNSSIFITETGVVRGEANGTGNTGVGGSKINFGGVTLWDGKDGELRGAFGYTPDVLPIELLSFNGAKENDYTLLTWETASEKDNDYYTIERSIDGYSWEAIIQVDGAGNSISRLSYESVDLQPFNGENYYRLKQTDFDGSYSFSNIVVVDFYKEQNLSLYPNPAQNVIGIANNTKEIVDVKIYAMDGRLINLYLNTLDNLNQIDISSLDKGEYFISIRLESETINKKFVKN